MKKHILYCNPKGGKFNWEKIFDLKNLPGKLDKYARVKVTFEKFAPMKTNKQMGYYRGGILPYLEKELYTDTGMEQADWHRELKENHGIKDQDKSGNFIIVRSLSKYSEKEMALFITKIINWVRDFFNVQVPPPQSIEEYI